MVVKASYAMSNQPLGLFFKGSSFASCYGVLPRWMQNKSNAHVWKTVWHVRLKVQHGNCWTRSETPSPAWSNNLLIDLQLHYQGVLVGQRGNAFKHSQTNMMTRVLNIQIYSNWHDNLTFVAACKRTERVCVCVSVYVCVTHVYLHLGLFVFMFVYVCAGHTKWLPCFEAQ